VVKNVGSFDRLLRIIAGAILIVIGLMTSWWWAVLGVIILVTGLLSSCLLYLPLRVNTVRIKTK
jgi:hypothetical protein